MKNSAILLQEQRVKSFIFHNRYVCAPFDIAKASDDGLLTEELLSIYEQRKGPSLIVVEQAAIAPNGQYREKLIFVDRDECIEGLSKLADVIHKNNQVAVLQINHAGSSADTSLTKMEAIAPSPLIHPNVKRSIPREMSIDEINEIKKDFVEAAIRTMKAGFDGVEIHNCHGFLLS
jgi:2,4-dienoyl-CoA reductase-like NADH-dependent reductase (Old Yellow Enzyme family)